MNILEDQPIVQQEEDLFHRQNLVNPIVEYIINSINTNHKCRCVAIYGKWGEGKTSCLNLIKKKLLEQQDNIRIKDKFKIYDFNPWIASNEETLMWDFFNTISKDKTKGVKDKLQKYSGLVNVGSQIIETAASATMGISPTAFIVGGALKKVSKLIKGSWDKSKEVLETINDKSLSDRKEAITKEIKSKEKHQIIFIDDIDRLDKDETHTVFRLIRQIADFDNTIYIIAMDPDIVSKSLGAYFGEGNVIDGRNFIDKIVQIPIQLPPINKKLFCKTIKKKLKILFAENLRLEDKANFDELCNTLASLFETERQVKKYVNQISFIIPSLKNEVNLFTLCKLESIKCIDNQAYLRIYHNREALCRESEESFKTIGHNTEKEVEDRYEETVLQILSTIPDTIRGQVHRLIDDLFSSNLFDIQMDLDNKSLSTDIYFYKYFQMIVPEGVISDQEADEVFRNFDTIAIYVISEQINTWVKTYNIKEILRILKQVVRKEKDENKQRDTAAKIIQALTDSKLIRKEDNKIRPDVSDVLFFICYDLIYQYINVIRNENGSISPNEKKVNEILSIIFKNTQVPIEICIDINYLIHNKLNLKDKSYINWITIRMHELSSEKFEKYDKEQIFPTLWEWKNEEIDGPSKFLREKLKDIKFNAKTCLNNYIGLEHKPNQIKNFILIFRDSAKTICEHLKEKGETEETCPQIKYILAVYNKIMANNN